MTDTSIAELQRFQINVARAMGAWQSVEITVQNFFVRTLQAPDWRWSAAVYNAVIGFTAKVAMLDELMQWRLTPSEVQDSAKYKALTLNRGLRSERD